MKVVLQKFIADSGYCSRRQAEKIIRSGAVKVNGKIVSVGERVDENDIVLINNKKVGSAAAKIFIKLNKPVGYTCTSRKFENEKNVFDLVNIKERLFVVGRLDKNSHGLVLLTNDGELAQKFTHPSYEVGKTYMVKVEAHEEKLTEDDVNNILRRFKNGIEIGEGDGSVRAADIEYLGDNKFKIVLNMGKKRQIRRMFKALNFRVDDLERIGIGRLKLGELKTGKWLALTPDEIKELKK